MFIKNKYWRWYFMIMEKAKGREIIHGHTERHHVIPRGLDGSDVSENIVNLTFREHFIAHWLLTKCTESKDQRKMFSSLIRMCCGGKNGRLITSWQYELRKKIGYKAFLGRKMSNEQKRKLSEMYKGIAFNKGKKHTDEAKAKISKARTGFKESEERKEQKRQFMLGNKNLLGHLHSDETRARMRETHMARPYKDRAVWLGKRFSDDHRRKISEANYKRHAFNRNLNRLAKLYSKRKSRNDDSQ